MSQPFSETLKRLISGEDLSRPEMEGWIGRIMDGELDEAQKSALLVGLASKGEAVSEIAGAAVAMRSRVIPIPHHRDDLVDTCGTGGDGKGTFNISTAAALVAAACGAAVAKHGNRSVSSRSGSADVLAALGVNLDIEPEQAGQCLDSIGIAFLFAPRLHPAMAEVMPVRRKLGVRTLFNLLGPLTNPAGAKRQLMGVYAPELVETVAGVLADLGTDHALVAHGFDGLDEITTTGPTRIGEVRDGSVRLYEIEPRDLGLERSRIEDLSGGDPHENALALRSVLEGEWGPLAEITALNAGAALYVSGRANDLREGFELARQALTHGAASAVLEELVRFTKGEHS